MADPQIWHAIGRLAGVLDGINNDRLIFNATSSIPASVPSKDQAATELTQKAQKTQQHNALIKETKAQLAAVTAAMTAATKARKPVDSLVAEITKYEKLLKDAAQLVTDENADMKILKTLNDKYKELATTMQKVEKLENEIAGFAAQHATLKQKEESEEAAVENDKKALP